MDFTANKFKLSLLAWAAQAALLAMAVGVAPAYAEEEMNDEVKELVMPTNTIEVGVIGLTGATDKSGEYNGLNHSGGVINGGFKLLGGDAYGMGSGTHRWSIEGRDLGTTSRSLEAQFSDQGNWSLGFGQDSIRHYTTNGDFKTPFTGAMGGNVFRWTGTPLNAGSVASGLVFNGGAH